MRSGQFCSCLTRFPFPFWASQTLQNGESIPRWLVRTDDGSNMGSHDVNLIQLCSTGFSVGFRVTAFSPMLATTWLSPQIAVGDAVTPASRRDGISPSRKLSCQDSIRIPPLFNLASCPQANCLFKLNESHTETYAKAVTVDLYSFQA